MKNIKDLQEKRDAISADMQKIVSGAEKEERGLSSEGRSKWEAMSASYGELNDSIKIIKEERSRMELITTNNTPKDEKELEHRSAFEKYLRVGKSEMTPAEVRTLKEFRDNTVAPDAKGGFIVGETFEKQVYENMKAFGGIASVARHINTATGEPLHYPVSNDLNAGAWTAETTAYDKKDATYAEIVYNAYKGTTEILVSEELLQDANIDIVAHISGLLGRRLGRLTSTAYAIGDGTAKPTGLVTGAGDGGTTATTAIIAYADIVNLLYSVDGYYRSSPSARFVISDEAEKAIRLMVDDNKRPIWTPAIGAGLSAGLEATILGKPYTVDYSMTGGLTAGDIPMVYGDMQEFIIRNVAPLRIRRLDEIHAENGMVAFLASFRTDSKLLAVAGNEPVKKLTIKA